MGPWVRTAWTIQGEEDANGATRSGSTSARGVVPARPQLILLCLIKILKAAIADRGLSTLENFAVIFDIYNGALQTC